MSLLAVDLGVRTGLALYDGDGQLVWYRSHNFGNQVRLKRGAYGILKDVPEVETIILEGGGGIAEIWKREGHKRGLEVLVISAETWRPMFLHKRERTNAADAKRHAGTFARKVINYFGAPKTKALRHDAAEAILVGLWGVLRTGRLSDVPPELKR